ncbi:MAG: DUF5108 domain-containing protein [Prevotella sp.]|nr:DUF5108 domain-containing protein [Prevotella sp.]MBR7053812.1 DUF5108 domain-containing protein [Prevotella sp.]
MKYMRLFTRHAFVIAAAAITFAACDKDVFDINTDPFKDEVYSTTLMSPISTFLTEQEGYGEYVKMLNYANMFNALNQSSSGTSFTAFVPTDDAMHEFYRRRGVDSLQQLSPEYAKAFILYHTVKDSILPESFVQKKSVQNLSGDIINISIDSLNAGQAILNNEGHVVEMGLSAYNGKVYVLSKAMTPLVETVFDRVVQEGRSAIMAEALQATGWARRLSVVQDTTLNEARQKVVTHYYFTLLNVTDDTFAKAGINSLDQLRSQLRAADEEGLADDSLLRKYVGYHVLTNQYTTDEMGAMTGSEATRIWSSSAANQVFTVTYDSLATREADKYVINNAGVPARFIPEASNILCKNGYLHNIDGWMPVWEPKQATVLWDLADYTEIKNMVDPEFYQPAEPTASEQRFRVATATCFEYEMGEAGSKNRNYSDIDYVTCRSNMKDANNHDRIVFNLGYMGKASMRTPTIVRGKYKVELTIIFMTGNNFMRQQTDGNGGMLKMAFDDKDEYTVFNAPYTKVPSALPGVYTSTIYEEIEFPETASHTFSFIVLDPAASTNSNFSLQFDYIKFTPIE